MAFILSRTGLNALTKCNRYIVVNGIYCCCFVQGHLFHRTEGKRNIRSLTLEVLYNHLLQKRHLNLKGNLNSKE
jgi:hypothetical protein